MLLTVLKSMKLKTNNWTEFSRYRLIRKLKAKNYLTLLKISISFLMMNLIIQSKKSNIVMAMNIKFRFLKRGFIFSMR